MVMPAGLNQQKAWEAQPLGAGDEVGCFVKTTDQRGMLFPEPVSLADTFS